MGKKKKREEYRIDAHCFVCGKAYKARYTVGDRAKVCTPPSHSCTRKTVKIPGRRDKLITCVDGCCRSKYTKGSVVSAGNAIDSRKFLSNREYELVLKELRKLDPLARITIGFIIETGCRCGEALLVRKNYIDWRSGPLSVIRMPTLKKAGHPLLPVHLDNNSAFAESLRIWVANYKDDDLIFPIAKRTLQRSFEKVLDKVKPDRVGLIHLLRHTRASRLIASGLDPNTVRSELRWSSIELLKVYAHTTEEAVAKAFGKIR